MPPFTDATLRTLKPLNPTLTETRTVLRRATPVVKRAATFARNADPASNGVMRLLVSLRKSGAFENLLATYYGGAGAGSRFDAASHLLVNNSNINACSVFSTTPVGGCDGTLDGKDETGAPTPTTGVEGPTTPGAGSTASKPRGKAASSADTGLLDYLLR